MNNQTVIAGVGMLPFVKPGQNKPYDIMGSEATNLALADAGLTYENISQAYVGWVYGDSTSGQKALYRTGLSGVPIINVNNNCSTGSTALFLANQAIASGVADCVLALGFEHMPAGAIQSVYSDRPNPLGDFLAIADTNFPETQQAPMALRLFAGAGYEHQQKYGTSNKAFAMVREKASLHAANNEKALFRQFTSAKDVLTSKQMLLNLTRLQCCPPTCGAAATVLCSEKFARQNGIDHRIKIVGQAMTTDTQSSFDSNSLIKAVGSDLTARAAQAVYQQAGIGPEDLDAVELHDCFTTNEVISYESLGLCDEGEAEAFIFDKKNTYGGHVVTNPSGGLLCKGHPLGATGLAQCAELVWQLRGAAGARQVENATTALQHNLGLGGACVITLYQSSKH